MGKEKVVKEEVKVESMNVKIEMSDGTVLTGVASLRKFQPNAKGFQNSGFQLTLSDGRYKGNVMIIDLDKQVRM